MTEARDWNLPAEELAVRQEADAKARALAEGWITDDPLPPSDLVVDPDSGSVRYRYPMPVSEESTDTVLDRQRAKDAKAARGRAIEASPYDHSHGRGGQTAIPQHVWRGLPATPDPAELHRAQLDRQIEIIEQLTSTGGELTVAQRERLAKIVGISRDLR